MFLGVVCGVFSPLPTLAHSVSGEANTHVYVREPLLCTICGLVWLAGGKGRAFPCLAH